MRLADQAECRAYGIEPYHALAQSRERSTGSYEVWVGDALVAEWGYRIDSFLSRHASVWCLSFDPADGHRIFFARRSRAIMNELLRHFAVLRCEVHAQHAQAVRWLTWLGFTMEHMRETVDGHIFLTMRRDA